MLATVKVQSAVYCKAVRPVLAIRVRAPPYFPQLPLHQLSPQQQRLGAADVSS